MPFPQLHFNASQNYVNVDTELNPEPNIQASQITNLLISSSNRTISTIPYGSIIYHSKEGVTTVFDANGNQLFAAEDENSAQIPTPKGSMMPATHVHVIPSGSAIVSVGNITYISNQNVVLFEEIDASPTASLTKPMAVDPPSVLPSSYIEGIEGVPTSSSLGNFITYWTVPSSPVNKLVKINTTFIWNGLESSSGPDVLIQPVLQWNTNTLPSQWQALASWAIIGVNGYESNIVSGVNPGDIILGQMTYSPNLKQWTILARDTSLTNMPTGKECYCIKCVAEFESKFNGLARIVVKYIGGFKFKSIHARGNEILYIRLTRHKC